MKKLSVVLIASAIVLGVGGTAGAAPYVSLNMGTVWVNDSDYSDSGTFYDGYDVYTYRDNGEFSFDPGFAINAAFGNDFGNGFRVEIEYGFKTNDIDRADGTYSEYNEYGVKIYSEDDADFFNGDFTSNSLMFNSFYDFAPRSPVSPFIGGGIGFANIESDFDYYGSEDDNVFAYQLGAGVAFALNPKMKIDVQYRFFGTEDPDFYGLEAEYLTHNLLIGLRTSF
jgi:opacity protein-like surface antigen